MSRCTYQTARFFLPHLCDMKLVAEGFISFSSPLGRPDWVGTRQRNAWSRVLQIPAVSQQVKRCNAPTVHYRAHNRTCPCPEPDQSRPLPRILFL